MVLRRGNSDPGHRRKDRVLLNRLANRALELVQVHASRLLHDFAYSRLALLERFESLVLRGEFFAAAAHALPREINFAQGKLACGVLG